MFRSDIDKWRKTSQWVRDTLMYLAKEYAKINNLIYDDIRINTERLEVDLWEQFRCEWDIIGSFKIEDRDLLCPNGVINKWKLKISS